MGRARVQPNHVWSDFPLWDVLWMMRRASFRERTMRALPQRHSVLHLPVRAARRAAQKRPPHERRGLGNIPMDIHEYQAKALL